MFLLKLFGSKKLIAALSGVLAIPAVLLASKFGLALDTVEVASAIGGIATVVLAYIAAQYRIDVETNGDTTTAKLLERLATGENGPVPSSVVVALRLVAGLVPQGPARDAVQRALEDLGEDG